MSLPGIEENGAKVIESKKICYFSNFDLDVNEWFNEYENIEIFKLNMKKKLGIIGFCQNFDFRANVVEVL